MADRLRLYASILGASGIATGAFGAHALKKTLEEKGTLPYWNTGVLYHLLHATAMLGLHAAAKNANSKGLYLRAGNLMMVGTTLFSGSLYMLSLEIGPKALWGPTTPIGGLFMIGGWVVLGMFP